MNKYLKVLKSQETIILDYSEIEKLNLGKWDACFLKRLALLKLAETCERPISDEKLLYNTLSNSLKETEFTYALKQINPTWLSRRKKRKSSVNAKTLTVQDIFMKSALRGENPPVFGASRYNTYLKYAKNNITFARKIKEINNNWYSYVSFDDNVTTQHQNKKIIENNIDKSISLKMSKDLDSEKMMKILNTINESNCKVNITIE